MPTKNSTQEFSPWLTSLRAPTFQMHYPLVLSPDPKSPPPVRWLGLDSFENLPFRPFRKYPFLADQEILQTN